MKLGLRQQVKQGLITHDEARQILWKTDPEATDENNTFLAWLRRRKKGKKGKRMVNNTPYEPDPIMDKIQGEEPCVLNDHGECRKHEVNHDA